MRFLIAFFIGTFFLHGVPSCSDIGYAQAAPIYSANKLVYKTVTIASGQTVSPAVDIGGYQLVAVSFPATMTGTTMTLQASSDIGGTYNPVYNSAGAVSYTIAGARCLSMVSADTHGLQYIKLVSGTAEAAQRVITLHLKAI